MIPLSLEEYFQMEVCMNCHVMMSIPVIFYLPDDNVLRLCEECAMGLQQCMECHRFLVGMEKDVCETCRVAQDTEEEEEGIELCALDAQTPPAF